MVRGAWSMKRSLLSRSWMVCSSAGLSAMRGRGRGILGGLRDGPRSERHARARTGLADSRWRSGLLGVVEA